MYRFTNSKWFYRILALFFALLLFFNANHSLDSNGSTITTDNNVYQEELKDIPIDFKYNTKKYYISPNVDKVSAHLESSNKVLLDTEANLQTRQLKVVGDLTNKGSGTYEVPLKVKQLNDAVKVDLDVKKVKVKVEPKATKRFKVQVDFDKQQLATGYQVSKTTISPDEVQVTAGKSTIDKINKVVAEIKDEHDINQTITRKVTLQAYDEMGKQLNVQFSTPIVSVTLQVGSSSKTVPINLLQKGTLPQGIESYQFLCDDQTVNLSGSKDQLDEIKGINAYIDITDIDQTETKKINLQIPKNIKSNLEKVTVTIVPIKVGEKPMDIQKTESTIN